MSEGVNFTAQVILSQGRQLQIMPSNGTACQRGNTFLVGVIRQDVSISINILWVCTAFLWLPQYLPFLSVNEAWDPEVPR